MPRRRAGVLLPLEEAVLEFGLRRLHEDGAGAFHGFAMAAELDASGGRGLTANGTLYKVLERLERQGLLTSRWEEASEYEESRPRRRLYRVSDEAARALQASIAARRRVPAPRPGLATR
jgi:PadR family transcriptional regulator